MYLNLKYNLNKYFFRIYLVTVFQIWKKTAFEYEKNYLIGLFSIQPLNVTFSKT